MLEVFFFAVSRHVRLGVLCRCPAVEIFSFSTLLCFTLGPGLHVTYLIYPTAKRKPDFVRPQPPSRDYWGFPWRVMGSILGVPGAVLKSGWEKGRNESFQVRLKEPLGTNSHQTIYKNSSGCRLLIGHKKCFVLLCPIGEQFLLSSFHEFVHDGYCLATLAQFVHQACACKGNFYFLLSPNQKRRNYRFTGKKTFGMLSAGAIQFATRIFCFWLITIYCK